MEFSRDDVWMVDVDLSSGLRAGLVHAVSAMERRRVVEERRYESHGICAGREPKQATSMIVLDGSLR